MSTFPGRSANENLPAGPVRAGFGERQDDPLIASARAADREAIQRWEDEGGRTLGNDPHLMPARRDDGRPLGSVRI